MPRFLVEQDDWQDEPTAPGLYLFRDATGVAVELRQVERGVAAKLVAYPFRSDLADFVELMTGEWYGPIEFAEIRGIDAKNSD